jgi:ABC-2 type transport system ATP-binding protein
MEQHMSATAVRAQGLSRTQGTFRLRALDFELPTGLVMGFVGPNGAGKTTTIKSLLGLLRTDAGQVELFDGQRPGSAAVRERIGVVLDQPFVSPDWRVGGLGRRVGRFYAGWDARRFQELLDRFDLDPAARVDTLSRGQGVKLSLALALAHDPELLILDEPTSGLDPVSRADVVDLLREFMVEETHTVLFSTHITSDLDNLADLILVIDAGSLAYSGSLDGLHEEFAMVHGSGDLSEEAGRSVLGLRRNGSRFDGLIRTSATPLFGPSTVIDAASTDDVVVHLARSGRARQESTL